MLTHDIRHRFLSFFEKHGHTIVPSDSLVPYHDPSLLFTNAGMVPFKNVFTGREKREYMRAVSIQKCMRAGGKHNDLENVGHTTRHHTFFEMLGNFSFGDYLREKAIYYAWSFLTQELNIPSERLSITVHKSDKETIRLWKSIAHMPNSKIITIDTDDNFWSMGNEGPCGPCTEIFFDHRPSDKEEFAQYFHADHKERWVEIWNIVFMTFNNHKENGQVPLPNPCVDTGMGIERLATVLQNKHDNYDTDIMRSLIETSAQISSTDPDNLLWRTSHRIIADHIRAICFLIVDGVFPSNDGRGYVLRRIMRRAIRHFDILNKKNNSLCSLIPCLVKNMGDYCKELQQSLDIIYQIIKKEEEKFRDTLSRGLKLLESVLQKLPSTQKVLPGSVVFQLYDTYGFPLDLTQDIAHSYNLTICTQEFDACLAKQKTKARQAWTGSGDKRQEDVWFDMQKDVAPTQFIGYSHHTYKARILAILHNGQRLLRISNQDIRSPSTFEIICDKTPFYAEQGGQIGDQGVVVDDAENTILNVLDTKKRLNFFVHTVFFNKKNTHLEVEVEDCFLWIIDHQKRMDVCANHTSTHLLHSILRQKLGNFVSQKGSLVSPHKLRFDFSYHKPLEWKTISAIEDEVNAVIRKNIPINVSIMPKEEAIEKGALAFFGEKYPSMVRVLNILEDSNSTENKFSSVELCGGTHVDDTGKIGLLKIIHETGIAAGVRRLEAVTGQHALDYIHDNEKKNILIANTLNTNTSNILPSIENLIEKNSNLTKTLESIKLNSILKSATQDNCFFRKVITHSTQKELMRLMSLARQHIDDGAIVLVGCDNDTKYNSSTKAHILISLVGRIAQKHSAADIIHKLSFAFDISGGGKKDFAQGGGKFILKVEKIFEFIHNMIGADNK